MARGGGGGFVIKLGLNKSHSDPPLSNPLFTQISSERRRISRPASRRSEHWFFRGYLLFFTLSCAILEIGAKTRRDAHDAEEEE
jgi:hypothetical protein